MACPLLIINLIPGKHSCCSEFQMNSCHEKRVKKILRSGGLSGPTLKPEKTHKSRAFPPYPSYFHPKTFNKYQRSAFTRQIFFWYQQFLRSPCHVTSEPWSYLLLGFLIYNYVRTCVATFLKRQLNFSLILSQSKFRSEVKKLSNFRLTFYLPTKVFFEKMGRVFSRKWIRFQAVCGNMWQLFLHLRNKAEEN